MLSLKEIAADEYQPGGGQGCTSVKKFLLETSEALSLSLSLREFYDSVRRMRNNVERTSVPREGSKIVRASRLGFLPR